MADEVDPIEMHQRQEAIDRAEDLYEKTSNALHAWEAIHVCLSGTFSIPIPVWCVKYISLVAANVFSLSCGVDFRSQPAAVPDRIDPDYAFKLVARALLISRQGKRNAFKELKNNVMKMRAAYQDLSVRDGKFTFDEGTGSKAVETKRRVTRKTARKHIAEGKKLITVKPKTS